MSFQPTEIKVTPFLPMKGIYYIGQYGTSGYATAAKGYLYHYYSLGTPICWDPLYFDDSEMEDSDSYNVVVKSLINKKIEHDFVIIHSTPDLWPGLYKQKRYAIEGRVIIGYCTWETNVVPENWVNCINGIVHELWVPSEYNKEHFAASGVTKLIRVVPHIFLPSSPLDRKKININDESVYTFYTIGELNSRKSILETISAFCNTFSSSDKVRLLIKTHYKDYTTKNRQICESQINSVLNRFPNHPNVIVMLDKCSSKQIAAIHAVGDCYVSLSKSEGFGLPIFDAHHMGKKIIATGYGGPMDFLKFSNADFVKYTLAPVDGMKNYAGFEDASRNQQWAIPDLIHASELMRKKYEESKNTIC